MVSGESKKWHPLTLSFAGPSASETDTSPNPFLDYRLQVSFTGPNGQLYDVPGFFDGDGNGGELGNVWRVRFAPEQAGTWTYQASFRTGPDVAVETDPNAGTPTDFDGAAGSFDVASRDPDAPGFLKWGSLEYVGGHYLKFRDGPYWLKGGTDSPENLLGYEGFDNTPNPHHSFSPHTEDWQAGDPIFDTAGADGGKGLIGAINYLSSEGVNSVYFLPMNIGGDGQDTSPYVGPVDWTGSPSNDNEHFDVSKLGQWEAAFAHAQSKGIHLHFVLGEAEEANKRELDEASLGVERKLFYREMVARFGHHLALQWNVSEEYDYKYPLDPEEVKAFAGYIQRQDPYDHPITVHNQGDPDGTWTPFLGDGRFSSTSLQYPGGVAGYGAEVEKWRVRSKEAGRPLSVSMDELRSVTPTNADLQRKEILWPTYLSGGQLEWYVRAEDQGLEDFRKYQAIWDYTWYARKFVEENLPFWEMEPRDELLTGESGGSGGGGGQVFAKVGEIYAVYLPDSSVTGSLDLSGTSGSFEKRWYNPRTGNFEGTSETVDGSGSVALGTPPSSSTEDWVVLVKACTSCPPPTDTTPPETTIDSGPSTPVNNSSASLTFSSTEAGSTFECSLDGATLDTCASPQAYDNLGEGKHTFQVHATDVAGNTDATPASHTWIVDTMAPTVNSVTPENNATSVTASADISAVFSEAVDASAIDGSTFTLLEQDATTPVSAAVDYDATSKKATLNPSSDLNPQTTYTASVKGDSDGVKDLAGNPLVDKTWSFTTAATSTAAGGLTGQYYDNKDLTNLKLTRADPKVDFSWGTGSPAPSIGADTFSVRWSGQLKADRSQTYTFYVTGNDGVRLWVNNRLIVNRWSDGARTNTGKIALNAGGWYPIKLEYYEGVKSAAVKLEYSSLNTPRQVVPSDHLRP